MIVENISKLKEIILNNESCKIAILDNNSIEFLMKVEAHVDAETIFHRYDIVLIPGWVKVEVEDSDLRKEYIDRLAIIENTYFSYINESDYAELIHSREADLFRVFYNCCGAIKPLVSTIKRHILKGQPIEDIEEYQTWLNIIYEQGLSGEILSNGRERKKNAGEISICVLGIILAYFYTESIENISIYTNDRDAYDFNNYALKKMQEETCYKEIKAKSITFISNDHLMYQLKNTYHITVEQLDLKYLRNQRWINFTRKIHDGSIEVCYKLINNDELIEMLKDLTLHIIF